MNTNVENTKFDIENKKMFESGIKANVGNVRLKRVAPFS